MPRERLAAPEQARSCNLVRGSGILGGKNGALGAQVTNGMANGKLEALLAEWRQKRLLILGLGVSNRPLARLLLEAGCRVTGCDRTDREKLDREVLDLEEQGLELRLGAG